MFTFTIKSYFPGLPNLGAQIGCAQNQYTAVQTDLKYPLIPSWINLKPYSAAFNNCKVLM